MSLSAAALALLLIVAALLLVFTLLSLARGGFAELRRSIRRWLETGRAARLLAVGSMTILGLTFTTTDGSIVAYAVTFLLGFAVFGLVLSVWWKVARVKYTEEWEIFDSEQRLVGRLKRSLAIATVLGIVLVGVLANITPGSPFRGL